MKFFAPLVVLLLQGVLAAPTPENGEFECCPKGTPPCPDPPECTCPVSYTERLLGGTHGMLGLRGSC